MLLDLTDAPDDPLERIIWLGGVQEQVAKELDEQLGECYFQARLTGRLPEAQALGGHSWRRVLAWTRRGNQQRGRTIRWNDGY